MGNKPGLLPKWLFVYTMLKTVSVLAIYRNDLGIFGSKWRSGSVYVYLALLLGIARLLASRKIARPGFYSWIATSFLAEGMFFVYGGVCGIYSIYRVIAEAFLVLFTLGWMVFLYPYYLLEDGEGRRRLGNKSEKHQ